MANPRTGVGQIFYGTKYENGAGGTGFGVLHPTQIFTLSRFVGNPIRYARKSFERPDNKQGMYRLPQLMGNTDSEFELQAMLRPQSTKTYDESSWLMKLLLGTNHQGATWNDALTFTVDTNGTGGGAPVASTQVSCEVLASGSLSAADIGALIAVKDAAGTYHIRRITSHAAGAGTNELIGWTPALPAAGGGGTGPADATTIYAVKTFYFDGDVDDQSGQFYSHGEDTYDQVYALGVNGSAVIKAVPYGDKPFVTVDCKFKCSKTAYATTDGAITPAITVPSSITPTTDDAGIDPISLVDGWDLQIEGFTAGVPDATCTPVQASEFELDLGYNLQPIEDGNYENGIIGWRPTFSDSMLKGSFTVPWGKAYEVLFEAGTDKHLCLTFGTAKATGMGCVYIPKINLLKPETIDKGGLQLMKIPFTVQQPYTVGAVAVGATQLLIGLCG